MPRDKLTWLRFINILGHQVNKKDFKIRFFKIHHIFSLHIFLHFSNIVFLLVQDHN
jgi:hypothetical protein